ncbi:MAG: hypothetical protein ABR529_10350 [Actinomycetota bacterium]
MSDRQRQRVDRLHAQPETRFEVADEASLILTEKLRHMYAAIQERMDGRSTVAWQPPPVTNRQRAHEARGAADVARSWFKMDDFAEACEQEAAEHEARANAEGEPSWHQLCWPSPRRWQPPGVSPVQAFMERIVATSKEDDT